MAVLMLLLSTVLSSLGPTRSAYAAPSQENEPPAFVIDTADNPVTISDVFDSQTGTVSRSIRITPVITNLVEVRMLASDLVHATRPELRIDRSNISLSKGTGLERNVPTDLKLTVTNIKHSGDYAGTLTFFAVGLPITRSQSINVSLHLQDKPAIQTVSDNLAIQAVRCTVLDCWLAGLLLPTRLRANDAVVQLSNKTATNVPVARAQAVLIGENSGLNVPTTLASMTSPRTVGAFDVTDVGLTLRLDSLASDRYNGAVRVWLTGQDDPLTLKTTVDVRDGPLWAVVAVLMGLVLGRLARDMDSPVAKKQVKLLPEYYRLRSDVDRLEDPQVRSATRAALDDLSNKIDSPDITLDVAQAALARTQGFLRLAQALEASTKTAAGLSSGDYKTQVETKIKAIRDDLIAGKLEDAERERQDLETFLKTPPVSKGLDDMPPVTDIGARGNIADVIGRAKVDAGDLTRQAQAALAWQSSRARQVLALLSGTPLITAATRYWFIRPLLAIVLLILLGLLGLQTLYVNNGTTFGAKGLYDYLGLVLWGLTTDVAQRSLLTAGGNTAAG